MNKDQFKTLYAQEPKKKFQDDFYVFDTETKITKNGNDYWGLRAKNDSFVFGVVYGRNFCTVIHSIDEFKSEFQKPRYKNKFVFAHNAEYDLSVLYNNIYTLDPTAIFNGKFITATNGNCKFGDSMNIYRFSVEKIGKIIGKEKHKEALDFTKPIEYPLSNEVINRCISDCEIVYDALFDFFQKVGDIRLTQASLSMSYFRRNHLKNNIIYNKRLVKYFYNSYYGGRTEAFKLGKTNAVVYDVNSMYPDKMLNSVFPDTRKLKRSSSVDIYTFLHILEHYEGCALLDLTHFEHFFGFIPYKYESKLFFPTGNFKVWINFPEIRLALKHNIISIHHVQECIYAEPCKSPFVSFVNELYTERKNSNDELTRTILKLLLNSLYGKFAQKIDTESIYIQNLETELHKIKESQEKGRFVKLDMFNSERLDCFLVQKRLKVMEPSFMIPSYASYITSNARVQLLEKMLELQKYNPVYCDTDSIFFETDPLIKTSKELGEWGKEEKIVKFIRGLKSYEYEENGKTINKIKGVPKHAKKIAENTYQYTNLIKTREGLRRNIDNGVQTLRTKIITNKYTKRETFADGTTEPLKINYDT